MPGLPFSLPGSLIASLPTNPGGVFDPVVGNIGLIGESVIMLHLGEPDGVYPSDAAGNLEDLAPDGATTMPSSVRCWAGSGRRFVQADSTALIARDKAGHDTVLTRDVTVQFIVSLDLADAIGTQTIIQRGDHDGTSGERVAYGLELEGLGDNQVELRWFWEDDAAVIHVETGGYFTSPGDGQFLLLTATRRWESTGRVVCRYYGGDTLLGEVVTTDGSIAGGTTGHTMIGGRLSGGAWSNFLQADLDELRVVDYEMSGDEVREVWRRLTVHQPNGVAMFAGMTPPGSGWYDNPGNNIGRLVKIQGQSLGLAIAKIEELRATWLPDAAYVETIARWERVCGLAPRPRDSLDVRRARVIAYLSRIRGFSLPALKQAFATVFDLPAEQVQIIEFSNRVDDSFETIDPRRWTGAQVAGGAGPYWSTVGGTLVFSAYAGDDLRWIKTRAQSILRTPISQGGRVLYGAGNAFTAQVKVSGYSIPDGSDGIVGLLAQNRITGETLWFGIAKDVDNVVKVGYRIFNGRTLGALQVLHTPATAGPYWLRILPRPRIVTIGNASSMRLGYSTTGPIDGFADTLVATGVAADWVGLAAMTDAVLADDMAAGYDDFTLTSYNGDRPMHWYAYRDPTLPGTPDMVGAELLALKMRPAHTYAGVTQNLAGVLCGDLRDGLCSRGPMGAP